MPAIGARGPMPALPTRAPAPAKVALPPILPPPSRSTGSVGSAVSGAARGRSLQLAAPPPKAAPIRVSPAEGGHGLAQASARQEMGSHAPTGAAYHQAVVDTFLHQGTKGQASILRGIQAADPVTRSAVHDALNSLGGGQKLALAGQFKQSGFLDKVMSNLGAGIGDYSKGSSKGASGSGVAAASPYKMFGGPTGQLAQGFKSDAVNLGPNTIQGIYKLGDTVAHGRFGDALSMLAQPYIHLATHPADLLQHPINSAMLFGGPEATIGRAAGAVARSGVLGDALKAGASTAREPLRLGPDVAGAPSPIQEARSFSPNVITKAAQVARDKRLTAKGLDPNVARPKPVMVPKLIANSLNIGLDAKTRRIADEMTAIRQMQGREDRSRAGQLIKAAAPHENVQNVVSHILQGVVRTPDTAVTDITHEINRLKAADTGTRTPKNIQNRQQVRDLSTALKNPQHIAEAFRSADTVRQYLHAADAYSVHAGVLNPDAALRSRLIQYAQAHMGATYDHKAGEFVVPAVGGGHRPLPTQEIIDHIDAFNKGAATKMGDPAYVGHYPGKVAPYRFYQAYRAARGSLQGAKKTGEAFRTGGYDHTYNGLIAQSARTAEALTKAGLHDRVVNRLGIGKPTVLHNPLDKSENGYFTPNEAVKYAHASTQDHFGNPIPGAPELVPMTAFNAKTPLGAIDHIQSPADLSHLDGVELRAIDSAMAEAKGRVTEPGKTPDQTRNVVLVPHAAMDQFKAQFAPTKPGARKLGQMTQQFKRTVLPYSTHWMTQIGTEAAFRSLVAGTLDPRNWKAGHQLMHELQTTVEGRNALREMVNATFYSRNDPLAKFNPNKSPVMEGLHHFPPTAVIMAAHNHYANTIGSLIGGLEHEARVMGLGKLARKQLQEFTGSYQAGIRLQGHNVALLASKLKTDPALVAKFGRQIDDTFGKYNKLSPQVRGAVQTVSPFLPWYLNAAKFVFWNLPVKHPVASSLLASLRQTMTQDAQDGKKMPLNEFQVSALAKVLPFGIYPEKPNVGSLLKGAAGYVAPQFSGVYNTIQGQNVFGDQPLRGPGGTVKSGTGGVVGPAVNSFLEGLLPGLSQIQTVGQGGGTGYGTSTFWNPQTKPGTGGDWKKVLNKIFNPAHAFISAGRPRASASGGAWTLGTGASSGGTTSGAGSGGKWTVAHTNPAGTHATADTWKVAPGG